MQISFEKLLLLRQRAWRPHGGDPEQLDQHLQAARNRSAALPHAITDEPPDDADKRDRAVAVGPVVIAKFAAVGVGCGSGNGHHYLSLFATGSPIIYVNEG
jgi:hypothetical protein